MKINQQDNRGSFGVPQSMQEAIERSRKEPPKKEEQQDPLFKEEKASPEEVESVAKDNEKIVEDVSVKGLLAKLETKIEDKDFDSLLFKGFIEKEVVAIKGKISPTFKTLVSEEYDLIDELLAEELANTTMTREGAEIRRSMWILSMAVVKVNGKPTVKPVMKEGLNEVDLKATAKLRKKVLSQMSPFVIDEMTKKFGVLTTVIRMLVQDPGELLKN